jgi:hypothetical protein
LNLSEAIMKPILTILRDNVYQRLNHLPFFADVCVVNNERGINADAIRATYSTHVKKSGKKGAAVLVDFARRRVTHPNVPGPCFDVTLPVLVLEHAANNRGKDGTHKTVEELADAVLGALHQASVTAEFYPLCALGADIAVEYDGAAGVLFCELEFGVATGLEAAPRVPRPSITAGGGTVTISVAAGFAGAEIWYVTDGSWPAPDNPAAKLYTEPFQPAGAGALVSAVAFLEGYQPSDVAGLGQTIN